MSKKQQAFELFSQGKRPSDPDLKALGLGNRTLYNYFQSFKKNGSSTKPSSTQTQTPDSAGSGATPATTDIKQAVTLVMSQRRFEMSATLPWLARDIAINEWGWDPKMSMEDFVDNYFYHTMKKMGYLIGAYMKTDQKEVEGNGQNSGVTG